MDYLHDRERSLACLRTAVGLMGKHSAVLDPLSYAVWYDYAAGGSPELRQALDEATATGGLLDQEQVRDLFLQYLAPPQSQASLAALTQVLGLAQQVSQSTDFARRVNDDLGRSLTTFQGRLQDSAEPAALGSAVQDLRQVSEQTQQSIGQVSTLLARHSAEMSRLRGELDQVRQEASIDGLTRVLNRRAFDAELTACLADLPKEGPLQRPCLLLMDIDHFKGINDSFGHPFGDEVLRAIGRALSAVATEGVSVGRFGGDEFALLMRRHPAPAASELAERLRTLVAGSRIRGAQGDETRSRVTISVGAAPHQHGLTVLQWLKRADAALYEAKRKGRNQVVWSVM